MEVWNGVHQLNLNSFWTNQNGLWSDNVCFKHRAPGTYLSVDDCKCDLFLWKLKSARPFNPQFANMQHFFPHYYLSFECYELSGLLQSISMTLLAAVFWLLHLQTCLWHFARALLSCLCVFVYMCLCVCVCVCVCVFYKCKTSYIFQWLWLHRSYCNFKSNWNVS